MSFPIIMISTTIDEDDKDVSLEQMKKVLLETKMGEIKSNNFCVEKMTFSSYEDMRQAVKMAYSIAEMTSPQDFIAVFTGDGKMLLHSTGGGDVDMDVQLM